MAQASMAAVTLAGKVEDLFGDEDEDHLDDAAGDSDLQDGAEDEGNALPGGKGRRGHGKGRGKGQGRGRAGDKKTGKTALARLDFCKCCRRDAVPFKPNKANCETCNPDIEAMRRDAASHGASAKKFLANLEKEAKKNTSFEGLHDCWAQWKASAGESTGASRIGFFNWSRYEERYYARQGSRKELGKVQVTEKEFIDKMEAKGRTREWAKAEWTRRRHLPDEFESGVCLDTGLPTCEMHEGPRNVDYQDKGLERAVLQGSKDQKMKKQDVVEMVHELSNTVGDVTRSTQFKCFKGEGNMSSLLDTKGDTSGVWDAQLNPVPEEAATSEARASKVPAASSGDAAEGAGAANDADEDWDFDEQIAKCKIETTDLLTELRTAVDTALLAADAALKSIAGNESTFGDSVQSLRRRFDALDAVKKGPVALQAHKATYPGLMEADGSATASPATPASAAPSTPAPGDQCM